MPVHSLVLKAFAVSAGMMILGACSGQGEAPSAPQSPVEIAAMPAGLIGDAAAGRAVFARCRSCHVLEPGVNRVGPSLSGIVGREAGTVEGFRYSRANQDSDLIWSRDALFAYLENPRAFMPGTTMSFAGLRDPQQRADVIAYLSAEGG